MLAVVVQVGAHRPSCRLIANYCSSRHLIISVRRGVRSSSAKPSAPAAAAAVMNAATAAAQRAASSLQIKSTRCDLVR